MADDRCHLCPACSKYAGASYPTTDLLEQQLNVTPYKAHALLFEHFLQSPLDNSKLRGSNFELTRG